MLVPFYSIYYNATYYACINFDNGYNEIASRNFSNESDGFFYKEISSNGRSQTTFKRRGGYVVENVNFYRVESVNEGEYVVKKS